MKAVELVCILAGHRWEWCAPCKKDVCTRCGRVLGERVR